jgi:PAS domain S-box-containing protein
MMHPEQNDEASEQIDDLLASPELAKAVETEQFKRFLDHIPIAIVVSRIASDGNRQRIIYANKAFENMTGQLAGDVVGNRWAVLDRFCLQENAQVKLGAALLKSDDFVGTFRLQHEGGEPIIAEVYANVIENEDGTDSYRIAALVDVTGRGHVTREEFDRQVREKDLLLKEMQHRVKNNLQLIIALIRFESRNAKRGDPVDLERLTSRIASLGLLYQTLSADGWGQDVDLGHFLSQIASAVMHSHAVAGIKLDLKVNYAPVTINVALPAGLAVNELLTNAFKYAFVGRETGTITLECLCEEQERYRIVVADDGVGMPDGIEWPMPGKLGALIVQTLRENTKIDLKIESAAGKGTRVSISFIHKLPLRKAN